MGIFKQEDSNKELFKEIINDNPIQLSESQEEEWKNEFKRIITSLNDIGRMEAEKFDKGILTLSSVFLGFTMTFVDRIIPLNKAWYKLLLYLSWGSFFISIFSILLGLLLSLKSLGITAQGAKKYLIERNANYIDYTNNNFGKWASKSNIISLLLFFVGTTIFIIFVILNISRL